MHGRTQAGGKGEPELLIEATFNAIYDIPSDHATSEEALGLFAHSNGTFNLWPYWREFVQSTAAKMGIAGLIVPTYRIEEGLARPATTARAKKATARRRT